jgi:hypothetical protein
MRSGKRSERQAATQIPAINAAAKTDRRRMLPALRSRAGDREPRRTPDERADQEQRMLLIVQIRNASTSPP